MTNAIVITTDRDFVDAAYSYDRAEHIGDKRFSIPAAASTFDYHFNKARSLMNLVAARYNTTYDDVLAAVRNYLR